MAKLRVKKRYIVAGLLSLAYGCLTEELHLWPADTYDRAILAFKASTLQSQEIRDVMSNQYLLDTRKIENIAARSRTTILSTEHLTPSLTFIAVGSDAAMLVDINGKPLHTWRLPLSKVWPNPPHIRDPNPDEMTRFIDAQIFPNGDVLAIYHADNDTPYGYGMVKMDKDSNIIWSFARNVHHDMYVSRDGRIYTLTHRYLENYATGVPHFQSPVLADAITVLSAEGQEQESINILEAFIHTPYEQFLYSHMGDLDITNHDYSHANSVMPLEDDIAAQFPMFATGDLLVSLRNMECVAVIDRQTHKVKWAMKGIWQQQHEAQFLPNGHIMLFDNKGYDDGDGDNHPHSRILEFDPATGAIAWVFAGADGASFYSSFHGSQQTLPNGNLFTVETGEGNRLMEITRDKQVLWTYVVNPKNFRDNPINKAYRVQPEWLTDDFRASLGPLPDTVTPTTVSVSKH